MWLLLFLSLAHAETNIQFIDSRDDSSITWLMIDDCAVPLKKLKLKNQEYVDAEVERVCHLDLGGKKSK